MKITQEVRDFARGKSLVDGPVDVESARAGEGTLILVSSLPLHAVGAASWM
jgi:hypothetical protein